MSKSQNKGKMKEWRRPEYDKDGNLIKQRPHVRRKEKETALNLRGLKL
jgi:hypothetical protein